MCLNVSQISTNTIKLASIGHPPDAALQNVAVGYLMSSYSTIFRDLWRFGTSTSPEVDKLYRARLEAVERLSLLKPN